MEAAARELLASDPEVIVAQEFTVLALRSLKTKPVVFGFSGDPLDVKLVQSWARPGGNFTGMSYLAIELVGKRIELLKEWLPQTRRIAVLARPQHPGEHLERQASGRRRIGFVSMQKGLSRSLDQVDQTKFDAAAAAVKALGLTIAWRPLSNSRDVDALFASIVAEGDQALYVVFDPLTIQAQKRIADLAISHRIPAVYEIRDYVMSGGLVSYTYLREHNFERAAAFVDKIFKGANPAELPVEQPTKFELVINLKTAKALGLEVPPTLLARADEVIE